MKVKVGSPVSYQYPDTKGSGEHEPVEVIETDQYIDVESITPHPDDTFCILTLKTYIEFTTQVAPLCLPEINKKHHVTVDGKLTGFGYGKERAVTVNIAAKEDFYVGF